MCFHNSLSQESQKVENRFHARFEQGANFAPVYYANGFTYPKWPVITTDNPDTITMYNWGLIPHWIKDHQEALDFRANTLNAKSETVYEKPSFKYSIKEKRCLVLSTGFYEWHNHDNKKYPFFIHMKNQEMFAIAGIFQHWTDKTTGEIMNTFSVLTTQANPMIEKIHNIKKRMPVIIAPDKEQQWLQHSLPESSIREFFTPFDDKQMQAHTISHLITSHTENPNTPEVQKVYHYPELSQGLFSA